MITTKNGDHGNTSLFSGKKVKKSDPIIKLIGNLDEIQALLGLVKVKLKTKKNSLFLEIVQKQIYLIMAEIAQSTPLDIENLKDWTKNIEDQQKSLLKKTKISNQFIIPGKSELEAWINFVRTRIRHIERLICNFANTRPASKKFIPYFNRLSDYFFVLSQSVI